MTSFQVGDVTITRIIEMESPTRADFLFADATPQEYRELARATVLSGRCWVMPVLANGRIYARANNGELVCLDVQSKTRTTRKPK